MFLRSSSLPLNVASCASKLCVALRMACVHYCVRASLKDDGRIQCGVNSEIQGPKLRMNWSRLSESRSATYEHGSVL